MASFAPVEVYDIAPWELVAAVSHGGGGTVQEGARMAALLEAVRANPSLPLRLRCSVSSNFSYQNPEPGAPAMPADPSARRRNLRILQRLGLCPGDTRPAIDLFERLLERIEDAEGLLGSAQAEGCYNERRGQGIGAILPGRKDMERQGAKEASCAALYEAESLRIRPHHLMCMACFYGGHPELSPIEEDNLYEAIDRIQRQPETPIELVPGPCMICPPCSHYRPEENRCIGGQNMALRDELKDLEVLDRLGLNYGDIRPAGELFKALFAKIPSTRTICGFGDGLERSPEWRVCGGPDGDSRYAKARAEGLGFL